MADYQANLEQAQATGISVYAISTDPLDKAQQTVDKSGLTFPVIYGVDGPATAATLTCWYEEKRNIIQPAAFIIDPARNILNVTYSSGPIGRLQIKDALELVGFYASKKISAITVDKDKGWTANVTGA